jgi:hypothetical protein
LDDFMMPRLQLDWSTGSQQAIVDVVRAGVATFVGSNGFIQSATADTQRVDWSKLTPGLLIEESRMNRILYSEDFSNVVYALTNASLTPNTTTSPDGTVNAATLKANSPAGRIAQSVTIPAGTYTLSCYIKRKTGTGQIGLSFNFDIAASTEAVDGTWKRFSITRTYASGASISPRIFIGSANDEIYIYGFQLEAGASLTSYIPTTAAAVTRNADVATITGTNFSDWWQAGLGGATVQALPSTVSGIRPLIQFDDGTANEIIALRGNTTNPELYIVDGGAPQAQIDAGTIAANIAYSLTGWWQTNDCKARKDSGAVVTDTTATIPTVTQARLGSDGANYLNGHLASINYYDQFSGQIYTRRKNKAVFTVI